MHKKFLQISSLALTCCALLSGKCDATMLIQNDTPAVITRVTIGLEAFRKPIGQRVSASTVETFEPTLQGGVQPNGQHSLAEVDDSPDYANFKNLIALVEKDNSYLCKYHVEWDEAGGGHHTAMIQPSSLTGAVHNAQVQQAGTLPQWDYRYGVPYKSWPVDPASWHLVISGPDANHDYEAAIVSASATHRRYQLPGQPPPTHSPY